MSGADAAGPSGEPVRLGTGHRFRATGDLDNFVPAWVLPLMRLMKGRARGDLAPAWAELPRALPFGVAVPPIEEAAIMLLKLGLA